MEENTNHKSRRTIILIIIGTAIIFALISTTRLFQQVNHDDVQIAGQIVSISTDSVTIRDKKGNETILIVSGETKMSDSLDNLVPGQYVHSFGSKTDEGTFNSKDIRVVKKP